MTHNRVAQLLQAGTEVSRFRVVSFLGAGGMGEVYKARDPMLDRDVALKILPPQLLTTSDAIHRFVHEAKTASSLNHPHIVTIHEIGTAQTGEGEAPLHYIAMELIDGEALRAKIDAGLSLGRVLDLLIQVAEALGKAHAAGVIHRDLKPENVMVSHDGYAKVVDFGLAKLLEAEAANDVQPSDVTTPIGLTRRGMVMGTVGYLAPEQIEGQPVDERADIFSFGCVLYESITGRQPFKASTVSETLRRIVHDAPPPITNTRLDAPADLERIVRKCLAKNPDERYQDMRDAAVDLREVRTRMSTGTVAVSPPRRAPWKWIAIAVAVLAIIAAGAWIASRPSRTPAVPVEETYTISPLTTVGNVTGGDVSPDGKYVAYTTRESGEYSMFLRLLKGEKPVRLLGPEKEAALSGPRFSGDGTHLYYARMDRIARKVTTWRIPILGGTPQRVLENPSSEVASSPDGKQIVFIRHNSSTTPHKDEVHIADADGANDRLLASVDEPRGLGAASWSPDGKRLFWVASQIIPTFESSVIEYDLATKQERVVSGPWDAAGSARALDANSIVLVGRRSPSDQFQIWKVRIADGSARRITNDATPYAGLRVPRDGSFLIAAKAQPMTDLWQVTPAGVKQITSSSATEGSVHCSAGDVLVYASISGSRYETRVRNLTTGEEQTLATTWEKMRDAVPTPDGTEIVYVAKSAEGGFNLWSMKLDGSAPVQLTRMKSAYSPDITSDGRTIVFAGWDGKHQRVWKVPLRGGTPVQLTKAWTSNPSVSADGKTIVATHWVEKPEAPRMPALFSAGSGEMIRILPLPPTANPFSGRWSLDGKSILYVDSRQGVSNVWAMPLEGGPPKPVTAFTEQDVYSYDLARDGSVICARGKSITDLHLIERDSTQR